jgi:hypothetical protein
MRIVAAIYRPASLAKRQRVLAIVPPQAEALAERAREQGVDARLELYAADGRLFHLFWLFVLEAEAFTPAGRLIRDVLSKTRGAAVSALIGGYRPMTRSSCRRRTPAGTSAIAASRTLVSSGEEARAMRAAAREPSTRWRARGARSRS